ncbi:hypothetical protein LSAT2_026843 [Lamellibrachia satsuma]|nr:hypothetical protein LSAT2_026843 [Lamellibrachia satsuma]
MSAFDKATPQNDRLPATLRAPNAPGFTMKRVMSSDRLPVMVSCRRREGNHPGPVAADTSLWTRIKIHRVFADPKLTWIATKKLSGQRNIITSGNINDADIPVSTMQP